MLAVLARSVPVRCGADLSILVCARLVVACAHAVFWSVASIMASRLVDTRHGALAISMIATGSSIA